MKTLVFLALALSSVPVMAGSVECTKTSDGLRCDTGVTCTGSIVDGYRCDGGVSCEPAVFGDLNCDNGVYCVGDYRGYTCDGGVYCKTIPTGFDCDGVPPWATHKQ